MPAVAACCPDSARRPEGTVTYQAVQGHLEPWLRLARSSEPDGDPIPAHVEREFRKYLTCGVLAHGFVRARCADCGHDFLVAFSCKGRGVCSLCSARRRTSWITFYRRCRCGSRCSRSRNGRVLVGHAAGPH